MDIHPTPVFKSFDEPDSMYTQTFDYSKIFGSDPPANYTSPNIARRRYGSYQAERTPKFHKLQRENVFLPPRAYKRFDSEVRTPPGNYRGTYLKSGVQSYSYYTNYILGVPDSVTTSRDECEFHIARLTEGVDLRVLEQQAIANINPSLDALTSAAEAKKTAGMILGTRQTAVNLLKDLRSSVALVRKGKVLKAADVTSKTFGDAWLQWRYGWRILGYDIQNAQQYLKQPILPLLRVGRAGLTIPESVTETSHSAFYYVQYDKVTQIDRLVGIRVNANVRFRGEAKNFIANPFITAWELVPFSFVADWFVTVGDALSSYQVLLNAAEVYTSVGMKFEETATSFPTNVQKGTGTYASTPFSAHAELYATTRYVSRSPLSGNDAGSRFHLPQINVNLTTPRLLDVAALLKSRIRFK